MNILWNDWQKGGMGFVASVQSLSIGDVVEWVLLQLAYCTGLRKEKCSPRGCTPTID